MTGFAEVNGETITQGRFSFGLQGRWTADLEVMTDDPRSLYGALDITIGKARLRGSATRSPEADQGGLVKVRAGGGGGGLSKTLPVRAYIATERRNLVSDILTESGESLSSTAQAAVLDVQVPRWTRKAEEGPAALRRVLAGTGAGFRCLPDGSWWVGVDTWPTVTVDATTTKEDKTAQWFELALEGLDVLPGMTVLGKQITSCTYAIDSKRLRCTASYQPGRGGVADQLDKAVKGMTAGLDYFATYACQVVGQNGDGTLELKSTDDRMPHLSKVPARVGIPGVTGFKVAPGIMVELTHENGDPQRPVVTAFAQGQALSVALAAHTEVTIDAPSIAMGSPSSAATPVALAQMVMAELTKLATTLASLTCSVGPVTAGSPYVPGQVAAQMVKAV